MRHIINSKLFLSFDWLFRSVTVGSDTSLYRQLTKYQCLLEMEEVAEVLKDSSQLKVRKCEARAHLMCSTCKGCFICSSINV